jgi:hypothetical protein
MTPRRVLIALAVLVVVAYLVALAKPADTDRIDPDDYARWRSYCVAEADRTVGRGARGWTAHVNDCLVDRATADAERER